MRTPPSRVYGLANVQIACARNRSDGYNKSANNLAEIYPAPIFPAHCIVYKTVSQAQASCQVGNVQWQNNLELCTHVNHIKLLRTMEPANVPDVDSLIALSLSISEQVNKYAALVRRQPGSPGPDPSLQTLQDQVNVVMKESTKLQALISDPDQWVTLAAWSYLDSVALGLSLDMDIPNHVEPGDKGATLDDLVRSTGASAVVISMNKLYLLASKIALIYLDDRTNHEAVHKSIDFPGT